MSAPITFSQFTSQTVLFANRDDANAFFNGISVPNATDTTAGVIARKGDNVTFTYSAPADDHVIMPYLDANGEAVTLHLASYNQYNLLKAQFEGLNTAFQGLLTQLRAIGVVKNS